MMFHTNLDEDEFNDAPFWPGEKDWEDTMNNLVDQGFFLCLGRYYASNEQVITWLRGAFGHTSQQMDSVKFLDLH